MSLCHIVYDRSHMINPRIDLGSSLWEPKKVGRKVMGSNLDEVIDLILPATIWPKCLLDL
jgi:hypothetical protein